MPALLAQDRVGDLHAHLVRLGAGLLATVPCSERASQNGRFVLGAYLTSWCKPPPVRHL